MDVFYIRVLFTPYERTKRRVSLVQIQKPESAQQTLRHCEVFHCREYQKGRIKKEKSGHRKVAFLYMASLENLFMCNMIAILSLDLHTTRVFEIL